MCTARRSRPSTAGTVTLNTSVHRAQLAVPDTEPDGEERLND